MKASTSATSATLNALEQHVLEGVLSKPEGDLATKLVKLGQAHLFEGWAGEKATSNAAPKRRLLAQLAKADADIEGGLGAYLATARRLLRAAQKSEHPFQGFDLAEPETTPLRKWDSEYMRYENAGREAISEVAFVLVAGGLGERMGYSGIKLEMPFKLVGEKTFFEHYAELLLSLESQFEQRTGKRLTIPLLIMTSPDTDRATKTFLHRIGYGGLSRGQVRFFKQEHVPALSNNQADLCLSKPFELMKKPHGHGDIHRLLFLANMPRRLLSMGKRLLFFVQDTNPQVSNIVLPSLGVFRLKGYEFLGVGIRREASERIGSLASLRRRGSSASRLCNVEYNHIDNMVRSGTLTTNEVKSFPGNTNMLLVDVELYGKVLDRTKGFVPEFVNPKYAGDDRKTFLKPARLETMMQDVLLQLPKGARTGVVEFERAWAFAPAKNAPASPPRKGKLSERAFASLETLASAEWTHYLMQFKLLRQMGVRMQSPGPSFRPTCIEGIPRVAMSPRFFASVGELQGRLKHATLHEGSSLVLDGEDITLDGLTLDQGAALWVRIGKGVSLEIVRTRIRRKGFAINETAPTKEARTAGLELFQLRGYQMPVGNAVRVEIEEPGRYRLVGGKLSKLGPA